MNGLPDDIPLEELATLIMLSEELDVPYNRVRRWADAGRTNNFPRPVGKFCGEGFFVRADVQRWLKIRAMTTKGRQASP